MPTRFELPLTVGNAGKSLIVNPTETGYLWLDTVATISVDGTGVISIDDTDPNNPIIVFNGVFTDAITMSGDGTPADPLVSNASGGQVNSIVPGANVTVDNTDPANPVVAAVVSGGVDTRVYDNTNQSGAVFNEINYYGINSPGSPFESQVQQPFYENIVVQRINISIRGNSLNGVALFTLRKNNVDTAFTVSVPSSTIGNFSITPIGLSFNPTDIFSISVNTTASTSGDFSKNGIQVVTQVSGGSPLGVQSVLGDNVDNTDPFNPVVEGFKTDVITLSSAQILLLFTTPQVLVPAQGVGKAIIVESVQMKLNYATTPYATNTTIKMVNPTGDQDYFLSSNVLPAVVSSLFTMKQVNGTAKIVANEPFQLSVNTGNPTAGDSTIDVYVTYKIITL